MIDKKIKRYNKEIKRKYLQGNSQFSDLLSNPTAASLKRACIELISDQKKSDFEVAKRFFDFKENGNYIREIEGFGIGKFKSITKFLKGESEYIKSHVALDLVAALVSYENRPYTKFLKEYDYTTKEDRKEKIGDLSVLEISTNLEGEKKTNSYGKESNKEQKKNFPLKKIIPFIGIIVISTSGYFFYDLDFANRYFGNCMVWKNNHYERVSCSGESLEVPFDKITMLNFKKIEVCDTTTFFRNDKPIVWYDKTNNVLSYFTYPRINPVNGKTLNPITQRIINSHVKPCDSIKRINQ